MYSLSQLSRLNINKSNNFDLFYLDLNLYSESITFENLNPFIFRTLKYLIVKGSVEHFDDNLFENLNQIKQISIKSDSLINFFHRGTKWINSINRNLYVNPLNQVNIQRFVSIEFDVLNWLFFNKYYTFPNEDICLFKNFPHSQLVLPLIVFDPIRFENSN